MNHFNKNKDKKLIDLVKNYPVLYDPSNSHYKSCIVKHKVWERISDIMQIPIPDLKRRWKHFRDHYHKKLRAESAGLKSLHTWEYMGHLSFLPDYSVQKEKDKEDSEEEEGENDSPDILPVQSVLSDNVLDFEEEIQPEIPKKKRGKIDTLADVLESRLAKRFSVDKEKSPVHKFFDSMADIVAGFPPHLAAEARLRVCQVVNEIEMKKHSEQQFL